MTAYTNKERDYFEANYPEFGTRRKVGMFIGPGFVFGGPGGSVIKAIPFLNYNHKFGFGGALKYMNTYNRTELGYASANEIFFLKGLQRLDDHLYLQYASNSFMDEWFLGRRMPKYMAEVYYDRRYVNKDFLAEGMNLSFRHRVGFGIMEDNDRNFYGEKISSTGIATTRMRYMAELNQHLYGYRNEEKRIEFDASLRCRVQRQYMVPAILSSLEGSVREFTCSIKTGCKILATSCQAILMNLQFRDMINTDMGIKVFTYQKHSVLTSTYLWVGQEILTFQMILRTVKCSKKMRLFSQSVLTI